MSRGLHHKIFDILSARAWFLIAGLAAVVLFIFAGVDRIVSWDEGVFFSQSGGYRGIPSPPMYVSPTREGGPIGLIWGIRRFGVDLHTVRLVWILISLVGAWAAFRWIGRSSGRRYGLIGFVVYFSFWITWVYSGVLHGPMLAGIAGLMTLAAYEATTKSKTSSTQIVTGFLLGLALSAMFWFRPVESTFVALAAAIYSLLFDFRIFWRRRPLAWLSAAIAFILAFVTPWSIWSTLYFGSVLERIKGMRAQSVNGPGLGFRWGVREWIDMLTGHGRTFGTFLQMPSWSNGVLVAGILLVLTAALATTAVGVTKWRAGDSAGARVRLLSASTFFMITTMYVFMYSHTTERYASLLWAYASWTVALALGDLTTRFQPRRSALATRRAALVVASVGLTVWLFAQLAVADVFRRGLYDAEVPIVDAAQLVEPMVSSGSCSAAVQVNLPLHQVLTGCRTSQIRNALSIGDAADTIKERGTSGYIFWIGDGAPDIDLGEGWIRLDAADLGSRRTLWVYEEPSAP